MLIEDFTNIDRMLKEKQIQPAQGKTEGNVLVLGGGPGSGKNWVISNLTDIKNRYKVFDVDSILEIASTLETPKFKNSFVEYLENMEDSVLSKELLDYYHKHDIIGFLKSKDSFFNQVLRDFVEYKDFPVNQKYSFLLSILNNKKPNIALNGTMRDTKSVISRLKLIGEAGYELDNNVDFLFVVTPTQEAISNATKRADDIRNVDVEFLLDAREGFIQNMMGVIKRQGELGKYARTVYVVFNSKADTSYYPNTDLVKDFTYMKIKPNDTQKVEQLEKLLKTDYA